MTSRFLLQNPLFCLSDATLRNFCKVLGFWLLIKSILVLSSLRDTDGTNKLFQSSSECGLGFWEGVKHARSRSLHPVLGCECLVLQLAHSFLTECE